MKRRLVFVAVIVLLGIGYAMAGTWATLDKPGAHSTYIYGIDGSNLVGWYADAISGRQHGFIYDSTTQDWTTIDQPRATETHIWGIQGDNLVGVSDIGGFLYNTTTQSWTTFDYAVTGIDGSNLVGWYVDSTTNHRHGYIYDLITQNLTTIDKPGAIHGTMVYDIQENIIAGLYYADSSGWQGFLYNTITQSWTNTDYFIRGIDGANFVGNYFDNTGYPHGFLYNITTQDWTTIDMPRGYEDRAYQTEARDVDGDTIVGNYYSDSWHGFVYTIPEPATLLLLSLGGLLIRKR